MPVTYRKVAFGGQVVSVDRLADGAFEVNFAVPPPGADQQAVERYRQNPDYARYADEVAAGATVAQVVKHCADAMGLAQGNVGAQLAALCTPLYQGWTAHGAASSGTARHRLGRRRDRGGHPRSFSG